MIIISKVYFKINFRIFINYVKVKDNAAIIMV